MSKHETTSMSRTLGTGSEEDFDVICDPCNNDGQRVKATGHCVVCNENMCISCMNFHKKLTVVKDHVIKDKSTLSQSQKARTMVNRSAVDTDPLIDRCPKHPDELIKFYCNSHCKLGCTDCISLDHRLCKDIIYIKEVSDDVANSDELIKTKTDIHMLVARLTSIQTRVKWIKQTVNDSYSQTVSDIRTLKREIIGKLDQFENEIIEKASLMNKERIDVLDSTVSVCNSAIRETEELFADVEKKKVRGHNNQLFISMKTAQSRVLDLVDAADQLCNDSNYERLSVRPHEQLNNLLSTLTGLGEVLLVSKTKNVSAKYQHDIHVKSETDTNDCGINSIIVLPDGRLAVADHNNMSMNLVNISNRTVDEQINFDTAPLDLTTITGDTIALTLFNERYIQVVSVSPSLSKIHTIAVSGLYYGIEYIPDKLILVCREPTSAVHICDMSGVILQQIETDYGGNKLFTRASRIAISPANNVMYVSDVYEYTVSCLTMDGKLISTSDNLKRPVGIACDDNGCAYVCGSKSNTIHQISPSGKLVKVLLDDNDGIAVPFGIAYRTGHLYITSKNPESPDNNNNANVYKLCS